MLQRSIVSVLRLSVGTDKFEAEMVQTGSDQGATCTVDMFCTPKSVASVSLHPSKTHANIHNGIIQTIH